MDYMDLAVCCSLNLITHSPVNFRVSMMTSSKGNIFRVTGPLCGEFTGLRWIPLTKASNAEFDVFFELCLNKRLTKQSWGWWFETLSCPLWRHCNATQRGYGVLCTFNYHVTVISNTTVPCSLTHVPRQCGIAGVYMPCNMWILVK